MLPGRFTLTTNKLGVSLHAQTAVGRVLTDSQGWANQYVADWGDAVTLMISGLPIPVKMPALSTERY